jgi:hypothetical protein
MTSRSDESAISVNFPRRLLLATLVLTVIACGWVIWNAYQPYAAAQTTKALASIYVALLLLGVLLASWFALQRSLHRWRAALLREIAERAQAEAALRNNQAMLHKIVAGTSVTGHAFFDALCWRRPPTAPWSSPTCITARSTCC